MSPNRPPVMPKLIFLPSNTTVEYEADTLAYQNEGKAESILDIALNYGVDLRHSCEGICACITCHVIVKKDDDCLSPMEKDEEDRLYRTSNLSLHSRLACRAVVLSKAARSEITVEVPDSSTERNRA